MVVEAAPAGCTPSHGSVDVYFLGPLGTYSHQAARELVAGQAASLCAKPTIEDTVQAGLSAFSCQGNAEGARPSLVVAPVENSFQGPVLEAFQCLARDEVFGSKGLEIVDEIHLTIAHALIVRSPQVDLAQVQVVRSHPQALGQCSEFLATQLSKATQEETASTAEAVHLLGEHDAAIASPLSAELMENVTRFIVATTDARSAAVAGLLNASRKERWTPQYLSRTLYRIVSETDLGSTLAAALSQPLHGWQLASAVHSVPTPEVHTFLLEMEATENDTLSIPTAPTEPLRSLLASLSVDVRLACLGTWRAPAYPRK